MYLVKRKSDGAELAAKTFDKASLAKVDKAKVSSTMTGVGINGSNNNKGIID